MKNYVILPNSQDKGNISWWTEYESSKLTIGSCIVLPESEFKPHYHEITEIYKITSGSGKMYIKPYTSSEKGIWKNVYFGDVIIIPPYTIHCCQTTSKIALTYIFDKGPFNTIKYFGWDMKSKL